VTPRRLLSTPMTGGLSRAKKPDRENLVGGGQISRWAKTRYSGGILKPQTGREFLMATSTPLDIERAAMRDEKSRAQWQKEKNTWIGGTPFQSAQSEGLIKKGWEAGGVGGKKRRLQPGARNECPRGIDKNGPLSFKGKRRYAPLQGP